jgi:hypothetical protein
MKILIKLILYLHLKNLLLKRLDLNCIIFKYIVELILNQQFTLQNPKLWIFRNQDHLL